MFKRVRAVRELGHSDQKEKDVSKMRLSLFRLQQLDLCRRSPACPGPTEGPGRVPAALPMAGEADGTSVQRKGAVQPAGRNATMRLGFAKSAKR